MLQGLARANPVNQRANPLNVAKDRIWETVATVNSVLRGQNQTAGCGCIENHTRRAHLVSVIELNCDYVAASVKRFVVIFRNALTDELDVWIIDKCVDWLSLNKNADFGGASCLL